MKLIIVTIVPALFLFCGCSTATKQAQVRQIERLQINIQSLEKTVEEKDKVISDLGKELDELQVQKQVQEKKADYKLTSKNIQKALINTGLYKGKIDGKIGPATKKAIISFQKSNGLVADGIVGKKTWSRLKDYL